MNTYVVWNDADPNDDFEVEAETLAEAYQKALEELGWVLGQRNGDAQYDTEDEKVSCDNGHSFDLQELEVPE